LTLQEESLTKNYSTEQCNFIGKTYRELNWEYEMYFMFSTIISYVWNLMSDPSISTME